MIFTLVGMPGAGKSCLGKAVSSKLKIKLIDADKMIEERTGKKLQTLIDEIGVVRFREIEEETLLSITPSPDTHYILSTGGSAIYSTKAMNYLKTIGKIIYLYCSYETIVERVGDYSQRGIVFKPGQDLLGLYEERVPLYEGFADITVSCDGKAYARYKKNLIKAITEAIEKE